MDRMKRVRVPNGVVEWWSTLSAERGVRNNKPPKIEDEDEDEDEKRVHPKSFVR